TREPRPFRPGSIMGQAPPARTTVPRDSWSATQPERGRHEPAVLGDFGPVLTDVGQRVLNNHVDNPDAEYAIVVTHPQSGKPLQLHPVNRRLFRGRHRDAINTLRQACTRPSGCTRPADACAT